MQPHRQTPQLFHCCGISSFAAGQGMFISHLFFVCLSRLLKNGWVVVSPFCVVPRCELIEKDWFSQTVIASDATRPTRFYLTWVQDIQSIQTSQWMYSCAYFEANITLLNIEWHHPADEMHLQQLQQYAQHSNQQMSTMPNALPKDSQILIVGAGTWGLAISYRLSKRGYTKIKVLDSHEFFSSTAAGNDLNKIIEECASSKCGPLNWD